MTLRGAVFVGKAMVTIGVVINAACATPASTPRPIRSALGMVPAGGGLPPVADPYRAQFNLDFEKVEAGQPVGWESGVGGSGPKGEGASDTAVVHGGGASYRLVAGRSDFGSAVVTIDATELRGKRVRLHAWVKTDAVDAGWAGVWLRVDDGTTGLDNMSGRGLTGTAEWREAVATVDVPQGAWVFALGPLIAGGGTAWFDDLSVDVADSPKPHPVVLTGVVVDDAGAPVAGADVTAFGSDGRPGGRGTTGGDGQFKFETTSGFGSVSALKAGLAGGFLAPRMIDGDVDALRLVLARTGGVEVVATVASDTAVPADVQVVAGPESDESGDVFALQPKPDGTFSATLPRGERYYARLWHGDDVSYGQGERAGEMDGTRGQRTNVIEFSLDPAPSHDVSAPFTQVGHPILIADLRAAPAGLVADWLAAPHTMRDTGSLFTSENTMSQAVTLIRLFDAVIFVDKTTRARPLPGGERPRRDAGPMATKTSAQ